MKLNKQKEKDKKLKLLPKRRDLRLKKLRD